MSDTTININITSEAIFRCSTISFVDLTIIQIYIIKKLLNTRVTKELVKTVFPDNDAVYMAIFELKSNRDRDIDIDIDIEENNNDTKEPWYKICHFVFEGTSYGFITKNGSILFTIDNDELTRNDDTPENDQTIAIYEYFKDRIKGHTYLDFSSIFYLSN